MKFTEYSEFTVTNKPLTFWKAVLLCVFFWGVRYGAGFLLLCVNLYYGLIPDILDLIIIMTIAWVTGKDELRRIFAWRSVPIPVFAGILVMFFGFEIIKSELSNLFLMILPIPDGFFDGRFYRPNNAFLLIISNALFPGFSEEVLFRGVIARNFFQKYSPTKSILLSAALFGITHLNPWQATNSFFGGIFYGWIYWRYKSIWPCIFIHAYNNILSHFMSSPYVKTGNSWHHPLWFNILGILLFLFGFSSVITMSRKNS